MYISTRGGKDRLSAANAIKFGIASDGGLFVPDQIPAFNQSELVDLVNMDYRQRAYAVLTKFLEDYSGQEIADCIQAAYNSDKFDTEQIVPLVAVGDNRYILELWHGPTSAFKDMALQLLPQLLSTALQKTNEKKEVVILVATSGDTGKAALEGFKDVEQIKIVVFFPHEGVSQIQRLQMITQEGSNVAVISVHGNFDDAQTGVKRIFNDTGIQSALLDKGYQLSSANSINWGRLVPQIVYYFSAYADLVKGRHIQQGQAVNFTVPTGNFGNILAGYYAKLMGLPINKLICASNSNNVLTDFLRSGVYDRNRDFHKTISPSMDILISSNLERLLYHLTGENAGQINDWMTKLQGVGTYSVGEYYLEKLRAVFWADWADDRETTQGMQTVFSQHRYLTDPHTAVAWQVYEKYRKATGDQTPTVIVSTASPFKFNESVLAALAKKDKSFDLNEFAMLTALSELTDWPVPAALASLKNKQTIHQQSCAKEEMMARVWEFLNKE